MASGLRAGRGSAGLAVVLGAALGLPARAQEKDAAKPAFDPAAYWVFSESYLPGHEREGAAPLPGAIGQYKVKFQETLRITGDNPGGAPKVQQSVVVASYSERPDEVVDDGESRVLSVVRRYDGVRHSLDAKAAPKPVPEMAGATFWIKHRPEVRPLILNLDPSKDFRFDSYHLMSSEVFVPDLASLLPNGSIQVGVNYDVTRDGGAGAVALVGSKVWLGFEGQRLSAKLVEVRPGREGKPWQAIFDVVGADTVAGIHAQLTFAFEPPPAEELAVAKNKADDAKALIHARGAIVEVLLATDMTTARPDRRLKDKVHRELVLRRSLADAGEPIKLPDATPEPSEENSWLTFIDPQNRYHLRIPQALNYDNRATTADTVLFSMPSDDGNTVQELAIQCGTNAEISPRDALERFFIQLRSEGQVVKPEPAERAQTWGNLRVEVRRAKIRNPDDPKDENAENFFGYAIRAPGNLTFLARARTLQPNPAEFRATVEDVLKTIRPGPPKGR